MSETGTETQTQVSIETKNEVIEEMTGSMGENIEETTQMTEEEPGLPSLFDINYQIKFVKCRNASLGTILIVLYRKVNNCIKEWKIQDGQYIVFNHIRDFYDNIDKLYVDALNVSSTHEYIELINALFENKTEGVWAHKNLMNEYISSPDKYIDKCDYYELVNLLYGKIRMYSQVLKNDGYKRRLTENTSTLSQILENFANSLPERKKKTSQTKVPRKDDKTGEIIETLHDVHEYYEDFADFVFKEMDKVIKTERSKANKNNSRRGSGDSGDSSGSSGNSNQSRRTGSNEKTVGSQRFRRGETTESRK